MQESIDILENIMKKIAKDHPDKLSGYYDKDGNWHQTIKISIPFGNIKPGDIFKSTD